MPSPTEPARPRYYYDPVDLAPTLAILESRAHELEQALLPLFWYCERTESKGTEMSEGAFRHVQQIRAVFESLANYDLLVKELLTGREYNEQRLRRYAAYLQDNFTTAYGARQARLAYAELQGEARAQRQEAASLYALLLRFMSAEDVAAAVPAATYTNPLVAEIEAELRKRDITSPF